MKLSEIQSMWKEDCQIDDTKLDIELIKIPNLHSKYLDLYNDECLQHKKYYYEKKRLIKWKTVYYAGKMSQDELEEHGWEPFMYKLVKGSEPKLETYLEGDSDIIQLSEKLDYIKQKVVFLEMIIKSLNTRGYNLRSAIDFLRFTMGS